MASPEQRPANQASSELLPGTALQVHADAEWPAPFDVSQRTKSFVAGFDILVCGPLYIDYLLLLDQAPATRRAGKIVREVRRAGGFGWNCAAILASWGARVALIGNRIGTDSNGRAIMHELALLPNLSLLSSVAEIETPYAVVSRVQSSRFSMRLERGDMSIERTLLPNARYAVFGAARNKGLFDHKTTAHLKRQRVPYLSRGIAFKTDWPPEASFLTMPVGADWMRRKLLSLGLGIANRRFDTTVICGDGLGGACLVAGEDASFVRAQTNDARDALNEEAAEDVFVAGVAWARWHGWSFERAIRFASAASVLKSQASDEAWPRLEDVESLAK